MDQSSLCLRITIFVLVAGAGLLAAAPVEPAALDAQTPASATSEWNGSVPFMLGLLFVIVVLFFWEPVPFYVLALGIPVTLVVFEPITEVSVSQALSGFSSEATITILAMFILSEGIQRSGFIQILGDKISEFSGDSVTRQIAAITGLSGPTAGIINNTPVVAIFIPMVSNLARRVKTSPSLLMIPLSYASMMGGTLTLIGSSTNLLASDISARMLDHPISFFEFTGVGLIILGVGSLYLIVFGQYLIPRRIDPEQDLAEEYEMGNFLTELTLESESALVGTNVEEASGELDDTVDLVQVVREEEQFMEPLQGKTLRAGDRLIVRSDPNSLLALLGREGITLWSQERISEEQLQETRKGQTVVPSGSFLEGQTLEEVNFPERYDTTVMAVRRGEKLTRTALNDVTIRAGDVLLLLASEKTLNRLRQNRNFIVAGEIHEEEFRRTRMPLSLGILGAVVLAAALGLLPIAVSALAGALAMTATGCVKPNELHESVDWEVIFLLAGLIPLGLSMEQTGTAQYLAKGVLEAAEYLPALGVLGLFYLATAVITNLIHKNASVVLMIPIAVDAAQSLGLRPFPFLLAVMFAASTAFLTPVGNHTNLMVYGPGGYRFSDFLKVGAPLQVLLAVVTPLAIAALRPLSG